MTLSTSHSRWPLPACASVLYFGANAWGRLFSSEPPPESSTVVIGGFVASGLLTGAGLFLLAELETPLVAARLLLSIGVLLVGVFLAFFVAMAFGMSEHEVLGYGLGFVILALTVVVLSFVLPAY